MPKLTINNQEIEVPEGTTVLQAAQMLGIEVPVFCYHPRLPIAGNCRMCLVEMEKSPKPIASCAMPAGEGMVIRTNSAMVEKARKGVLEFLLINHPLDCPICDQGGECDLQDLTMAYGPSTSRFEENKRAVPDKPMGPLIKTQMTRCIHCTRCVRFATEISGVPEMGAVGRGEHMEITSYLDRAVSSEMSGNMVDICPVGALTSKPYAFRGRPWELTKTESIDVMDAVGSSIRVDTAGPKVVRILPRLNEDVNEEWISDKTRFACDGLKRQRLDRPYVRRDGKLVPASWDEAFTAISGRMKGLAPSKIAALAGDMVDVETLFAARHLMTALGSPHMDCRPQGSMIDPTCRASYLFNTRIAGIEQADFCLGIQVSPRVEAPLIAARLRKRYLQGGLTLASIGGAQPESRPWTMPFTDYGASPAVLEEVLAGKHPLAKALQAAKNPMIMVGEGALSRADGDAIAGLLHQICEKFNVVRKDWCGFNMLHTAAARVGALDVGFVPGPKGMDTAGILAGAQSGAIEVLYLLGADDYDMQKLGKAFVIYQGHHGDAGAHRADVILPGAAYTEKEATYVNTEGRPQRTNAALFPPLDARVDWQIVRELGTVLGQSLPYENLEELRAALVAAHPLFGHMNQVTPADWGPFGGRGALKPTPFDDHQDSFYMSDVISRHSATMASCVEQFATHGAATHQGRAIND